jgi:hypothetical protein
VNIVLLPKKEGIGELSDYRPISLIHAIAKIIAKMVAIRLDLLMNGLFSNTQSAFIKKISIHNNFMYVWNLGRRLHKNKILTFLFKLDIAKSFDSVSWGYILELLKRHGFPPKFRDWIATFLCTSSSRVLLNGVTGLPAKHGRGLRQGYPLSPLLFVLAIDPLQQIIVLASPKIWGEETSLEPHYMQTTSPFLFTREEKIQNLTSILEAFGEVTQLETNFNKSMVVPIHCQDVDIDSIFTGLPVVRDTFPIKYLGLPLSVWQLKRVNFQPLEDKMADKLITWDGKNINMASRWALVKSVLTSQSI